MNKDLRGYKANIISTIVDGNVNNGDNASYKAKVLSINKGDCFRTTW